LIGYDGYFVRAAKLRGRNEKMSSTKFWNDIFAQDCAYSAIEMPDLKSPPLQAALSHFGNVENKSIIDLGCGNGSTSLFFASQGANVISVDLSEVAIKNLAEYCEKNHINNIKPVHMSALEIETIGKVDFIFGSMVLHHIEPFEEFASILRNSLKTNGKGFFWENNARSHVMIWFRQHIVGKFWVPKYGDEDEFPLTPDEVSMLKRHFNVEIEFPELLFFRMISTYLFRGHFSTHFLLLDKFFYRFQTIRKYSYRQYLYLS